MNNSAQRKPGKKDTRGSGIPSPGARPIPEESFAGAVISFGRLLKDHGLAVSPASLMDALSAIAKVGVESVEDFKQALKSVFLTRVEETETFERLFFEFWLERSSLAPDFLRADDKSPLRRNDLSPGDDEAASAEEDVVASVAGLSDSQDLEARNALPYVMYSPREVLRNVDFKELPEGEDPRMARLIREILQPFLKRSGSRRRSVESGVSVDFRLLFRKCSRYGGEILEIPRLKKKRRVKKLVFMCDVSGSMNPYLRFMLRFIKELQHVPTRVETFVFATRLHRVTPLLVRLPFHRAMEEISHAVKDWSGGTRIGASLAELNAYRGGGMITSSTVLLLHSDGWDRGDLDLLEREMTKVQRKAYRLIWINPLLGSSQYEPTCRGMKTALPHVDSFLPGHNMGALERLVRTLRGLL